MSGNCCAFSLGELSIVLPRNCFAVSSEELSTVLPKIILRTYQEVDSPGNFFRVCKSLGRKKITQLKNPWDGTNKDCKTNSGKNTVDGFSVCS